MDVAFPFGVTGTVVQFTQHAESKFPVFLAIIILSPHRLLLLYCSRKKQKKRFHNSWSSVILLLFNPCVLCIAPCTVISGAPPGFLSDVFICLICENNSAVEKVQSNKISHEAGKYYQTSQNMTKMMDDFGV